MGGDREDRLRVDGHPRLGARAGVGGKELVVVQDDPVVDPHDRPVPHRVVVGIDRRVALRVVADVHEQLVGALGHRHTLEELRGRRALLHNRRIDLSGGAIGVSNGIRAALGNCR
jgi:hypothetical protein